MPPYRPATPAGAARATRRAMRHLILAAALSCLAMPGGAQPVYRCGNTYGQQACRGGRVVDTAPQIISSGPAQGTSTVYFCRGRAGGRFWTPRHCHEHGAWVDRTETVPAGMPWEEQRAAAIAQRRQMGALAAPAPRRRSANDGLAASHRRTGPPRRPPHPRPAGTARPAPHSR
ncbi:hypothetical protein QRO08_16825 [Paracidovorax citrulli]|uniref:DUF4124 domain-containing protein n=3 Tax=Paracidovorax citrulli TaxID=80869 RepID=A1TMJ3_PARC0|nr:hypothetical protein [Paracidovorax citrulli]ABM32181.1 hypothetical protein Aave_1594 [Paracidovorax citrulli AAC00-1]WIY27939.1 hypothetical protein QRO09_12705 [Paracidovorax citrulli]WIY37171.1 hypothetical protein QRO10_12980 [Paracidovorax citrulli]WIY45615.1 hypothetical protein QRO12_08075 [Paracidovorax citrulli]WIY47493.1 hypothetical protein QRO08_16825 [Paracidovorax citrulli]